MNELKKNDFLATLVKNPDVSLVDLKENNITPDNTSLLTKDEYKNIPSVIDVFKDENGKFDEKRFNTVYDNAKILYSRYAEESLTDNILTNLTYGADAWFAPSDSTFRDDSPAVVLNQRASDYQQGIKYITEATISEQELSIREIAQREKVVNFETGDTLDYSPNDKAGFFSRFTLPTLVLAQWDEDGTHIENGIEINHKKGEYKLNNRGKYYYETLGDREVYEKDVLRNSDILTVDGSNWNKLDFFDSDDVKKSVGAVAMNTVAKIAPMFIPWGVGEIYGYVTAADGLMSTIPTFLKAVNGIIMGDNDNVLGKGLSKWEGYSERFKATQSDYGRENLVSWEGLGNLVADISGQLFQQRAVSTIPTILKRVGAIEKTKNVADVSRKLSLAYMAATSAREMYGEFKKAGATDRVAGLALLAGAASLYKLMSIDYFRDTLFRDTFMDENEVRNALRNVTKETAEKLAATTKAATKKEAATFLQKVSSFYQDKLLSGALNTGFKGVINKGLSEGTEEVMEEVSSDLIKVVTEGLNALGMPVSKDNLNFEWSAKDFIQRYGMSFAGGFIGGNLFSAQNAYEEWLGDKLTGRISIKKNDMEKLVYFLATGKRADIDKYLNKWYNRGILGSSNVSIDGAMTHTLDGKIEFIPNTKGISQNDATYQTIKNMLDTFEQTIKSEVDITSLNPEGYKDLITMGYSDEEIINNPKLINASALVALNDYSSFQNDLFKNLTNLVETKLELENKIKELSEPTSTIDERKTQAENIKNNPEIKKLQEKLKKLREEKDKFFNGEKNKYYSGQAIFSAKSFVYNDLIDVTKDGYVNLKYERTYDSFNDEQKQEIDKEYDEYIKKEGRQNIYKAYDLYLELSKKYAGIINEHGKNLDKFFKDGAENKKLIGITDFLELQDIFTKLRAESDGLNSIEEDKLTDEQKIRKNEIGIELSEVVNKLTLMINNPQLLMISPTENSAIEQLKNLSIYGGRIIINDDYSANKNNIDIRFTKNLIDQIKKQYREQGGEYKFDDNELNAFLIGLNRSYLANGGANARIDEYNSFLSGKYLVDISDDEQIFDEAVAAAIDKDPYQRWMYGRLDNAYPEIKRIAENIMVSLGVDNKAAMDYYRELVEFIEEVTNMKEGDVHWKEFIDIILPTIDGENIIDIVKEIDWYRENINYSAFLDLASKISTDLDSVNLIKLIETESRNLANSERIDDYIIRSESVNKSLDLNKIKPIFNAINSVIRGAADGTNDTINNFKGGDEIPILATMSEKAAKHILQQSDELKNRIIFLKTLSDTNQNRSLRMHKLTSVVMRPKWAKSIVDISDSIKKEFDIDVEKLWNKTTGNLTFTPNDENFIEWEKKCIEFEQVLYDTFNEKYSDKTDVVKMKELADKLTNLFSVENLHKSEPTRLTPDPTEKIGERDLLLHLATLISVPSKAFYSAYSAVLKEHNDSAVNGEKLAPIYGHEYVIKQITAQGINMNLFNHMLDNIYDNADHGNIPESFLKYHKNKSRLYNTAVILGGAGTGKTIGIAKNVLSVLKNSVETDTLYIAKETEQAEKLRNSAGDTKGAYTVDEYCKETFGEVVSNYVWNNEASHFEAQSSIDSKGSLFDKSSKLKIAVIDEIEILTEAELSRISEDAKSNGILIIGIGDLKQPGTIITGKKADSKDTKSNPSDIEDCNYLSTPILSTSMRSLTVAKTENTNYLSGALDAVIKETYKNPNITVQERSDLISEYIKKSKLYYYEDNATGELFGDMKVNSKEEFDKRIESLSKLGGTIAIISDHIGDYKEYETKGIKLVPYEKRAGGEYDYVLVDVDLLKHNSLGGRSSLYLLTRDLYTLTQRSRKGTVILGSSSLNDFKFVPNKEKKQVIEISPKEMSDFIDWRYKALEELSSDKYALKEFVNESPLVSGNTRKRYIPPSLQSREKKNPYTEPKITIAEKQDTVRDIKELVNSYFSNDGTIVTAEDFLRVLSEVFTDAKDEILEWINKNKDDLTSVQELLKYSKEAYRIIDSKYGKKGAELADVFYDNPNGFVLDEDLSTKINDLNSKNNKSTENNEPVLTENISTGDILDVLDSDEFYDWSKEHVGGINGFNGIEKIIIELSNKDTRKSVLNEIGSSVRCGFFSDQELSSINASLGIRRKLNAFSRGSHDLKIIPYTNANDGTQRGLLISRHYNTDKSQFFDVPVLVVNNPKQFGTYTGEIQISGSPNIVRDNGKRLTLKEFKAKYPRYKFSNMSGIVKIKDTDRIKGVNDRTKKMLKENNGKPFIMVTDESAIAKHVFGAGLKGAFKTDFANGVSLHHYKKFHFMGIQCCVQLEHFLGILKKYSKMADITDYSEQVFMDGDSQESSETVASNILDDFSFIKDKKGKIRQLLPYGRAGKVLHSLFMNDNSVAWKLNVFLHTMSTTDYKKMNTLEIYDGNKTHTVAIKDGKYFLCEVSNCEVTPYPNQHGYSGNISGLRKLITDNFGNSELSMHVKYNQYGIKTRREFTRDYSTNFELSYFLSDINPLDIKNYEFVNDTGYLNGIYLDDKSIKEDADEGSFYALLDMGGRDYSTDRVKILSGTTFNIDKDAVTPFEALTLSQNPTDNNPIPVQYTVSLNEFLKQNKLGITAKSVNEANLKLKQRSNNWKYQYIIESNGNFELKTSDNGNFNNWLKDRYKIETNVNNAAITYIENSNKGFVLTENNTILVFMKKSDGTYKFYQSDSDEINNFLRYAIGNNLLENYALSRIFENEFVFNDNLTLMVAMRNNPDLLNVYSDFESKFDCF